MQGRRIIAYEHTVADYITLQEAKDHLQVVGTAHDSVITALLDAAFMQASNHVGYSIRQARTEYFFNTGDKLQIPARVLSIEGMEYRNSSGVITPLTPGVDYEDPEAIIGTHGYTIPMRQLPTSLATYSWAYRVEVMEGFYSAADTAAPGDTLPGDILSAIKLLLTDLFEQRGQQSVVQLYNLPLGVPALLRPYQVLLIR